MPRRQSAALHRLILRPTAACLVAAAVGAAPGWAAEPVRPLGVAGRLGNERLSNERTLTRLAHPVRRSLISARPTRSARGIGHLRLSTEDGPPEVYLVLASRVQRFTGRTWLRIRVPGRPNGRTGWVPRKALGAMFGVRTQLVINRWTLRAVLRRRGRVIWRSPIGVGAGPTPTPRGRYWIRTRLRNLRGSPIYGPWAFGTAAYSGLSDWPGGGVIGVHGTNQPSLIPGRPSHGCIRVPNPRIRRLARRMPLGTPVRIL